MCGRQIGEGVVCNDCYREMVRPFSIDGVVGVKRVWSLGNYTGRLRQLIQAFKFNQDIAAKRVLVYMLAKEYSKVIREFDFVVPVPMEPIKMVFRGYNQSKVVAEELGRLTDVPVKDILSKKSGVKDQVGLSREERWVNVRNAFTLRAPVSANRVLVVDDILTTGATLSAVASVLRVSGVKEVYGIVLAR